MLWRNYVKLLRKIDRQLNIDNLLPIEIFEMAAEYMKDSAKIWIFSISLGGCDFTR